MMPKSPKTVVHTLFTALEKLRSYCGYQERSQQEVRDKLYSLGMNKEEVEQGLTALITEGFVNEGRFAEAYARGKHRAKRWGRIKIRMGLKRHGVSDACIRRALESLDDSEYLATLRKLLDIKRKSLGGKDDFKTKQSLMRAGISHGFEPDLVGDCLRMDVDEN
ncbi:MAG: regulatory protein RecX [Bacteroidota bacterium]|jgi:regulatory protein